MNNEEIINKEFDKRKQKWLDTNCTELNYLLLMIIFFMITKILKLMNEARSDTTKEIFKELDKIKCKGNHKGSATYDNDKYMDVIHVEDYEMIKKTYKVD